MRTATGGRGRLDDAGGPGRLATPFAARDRRARTAATIVGASSPRGGTALAPTAPGEEVGGRVDGEQDERGEEQQ